MLWKAYRSRCRPWPTPWGRSARRSILSFALWKAMSWRQSACMGMIRPCRFWPREKPIQGDAGYIYATTDPLAEPGRRRRYFTTHAIAGASILRGIWLDMPASSKQMPMTGTTSSIRPGEVLGPSWRRLVGCMPGARSSPWPTSRKTLDAKPQARKRSRCRPSRSRSCAASTRCSRSSDPSMARAPRSAWPSGRYRAGHWSTIFMSICVRRSLGSLAGTTWPKRSITFLSAGQALLSSSRTAAYASPTTPPKEG